MDAAPELVPAPAPEAASVPPPPARTVAGPWDVLWAVVLILSINGLLALPLMLTHVIDARRPDFGLRWLPVDAVITLAVAWWFASRQYRRPLRQAWSYLPVPAHLLGLGGLLGFACALLVFLLPGGSKAMPMYAMMNDLLSRPGGGLIILGVALLAAVMEETYYRGFIFAALADSWGQRRAMFVVASWFALMHAPQLGFHWFSVGVVALVSVVVTGLRAYSGSILPGLATHLTYNFCLTAPSAIWSVKQLFHRG
jgi:membrane protease YdiL (CAAX protease family)